MWLSRFLRLLLGRLCGIRHQPRVEAKDRIPMWSWTPFQSFFKKLLLLCCAQTVFFFHYFLEKCLKNFFRFLRFVKLCLLQWMSPHNAMNDCCKSGQSSCASIYYYFWFFKRFFLKVIIQAELGVCVQTKQKLTLIIQNIMCIVVYFYVLSRSWVNQRFKIR